ncbi:MAG: oligosaccharide flippase family protein [Polyangiaceae bacterium]|jgi:O-antigen/teichoic acid export membrane protein
MSAPLDSPAKTEPVDESVALPEKVSLETPLSATRAIHAHEIGLAIRNTLQLAASLILTWSVALIVKLQVPAHLGPVRQGHFGFAESFAGMFFSTIGLGVDTYIMKELPVRPKHASDFVGGIFALRAAISIVLFGVILVTLHSTGRPAEIQLAVIVFGLSQFVAAVGSTLGCVMQATSRVGPLAIANVIAKLTWGIGLLIGLHFEVPLYFLALPALVAELVRLVVLIPGARRAASLRYRIDSRSVRSVLLASLPFFVSGMAIGFGSNLAMSALEFIRRDEREVGWFAATQNLATLSMLLYPLLGWVIMPLLSRANARSPIEMMAILRRCIEALIVLIAPITICISVGSELWIKLAFGIKYAPAAIGLSILSLQFVITYLNIVLSSGLIILGRSWSTTIISLVAILSMTLFMLVFVPIGRALFGTGTGGECAGAAMAAIANELCVIVAMITRFDVTPIDRRNVAALTKLALLSFMILVLNRLAYRIGFVRIPIDMALYIALMFATRVVRVSDVRRALRIVQARRAPAGA